MTFDGVATPITNNTHTSIVFQLPPGQGVNLTIVVNTGAQSSVPLSVFSYNPPVITDVSPLLGPTDGNADLVVTGLNFGTTTWTIIFNGATCTTKSRTETRIICQLPVGGGSSNTLFVRVDTQQSVVRAFQYFPPWISTVEPQNGITTGGVLITLRGSNFGTTGTVTVGGRQCAATVPAQYNHTTTICVLPVGSGLDQSVVITAFGQSSNASLYNHQKPSIVSVTSTSAPTSGGVPVTITGSSFGLVGYVTIGGVNATLTAGGVGFQHTVTVVDLPAGSGSNKRVFIYSNGQSNTVPGYLNYDPPTISSVSPTSLPTAGGIAVTLSGTNYGTKVNLASVTIGGTPCNVTFVNETRIICTSPAGYGTNVVVGVTINARSNVVAFNALSYNAPQIVSVSGCSPASNPNATARCPINGGVQTITITGTDFGPGVGTVLVNSRPCLNPSYPVLHTTITCLLPKGVGFDVPVQVLVGSVSDTENLLSFLGPTLDSTHIIAGVAYSSYSSVDPALGTVITLTGQGFGNDSTRVSVTFGPTNWPGFSITSFTCSVNTGSTNSTQIVCTIPPAQGVELRFQVQVSNLDPELGNQYSQPSTHTVGYSVPEFTPTSLRFPGKAGQDALTGTISDGQYMEFSGSNFGLTLSHVSIKHGPAGDKKTYSCIDASFVSATSLQCRTQAGSGGRYVFEVTAVNSKSAESPFTFKYPTVPTVNRVSGCTDIGNATFDCPTNGLNNMTNSAITLTIDGLDFASMDMTVTLGGSACIPIFSSNTRLFCELPIGVGFNKNVLVGIGPLFATPKPLLNYARPVLTSHFRMLWLWKLHCGLLDDRLDEHHDFGSRFGSRKRHRACRWCQLLERAAQSIESIHRAELSSPTIVRIESFRRGHPK